MEESGQHHDFFVASQGEPFPMEESGRHVDFSDGVESPKAGRVRVIAREVARRRGVRDGGKGMVVKCSGDG